MIFLIFAAGMITGGIAGWTGAWLAVPARRKRHADYKQRWESAVALLGDQGQLTEEQVRQITAGEQETPAPEGMPQKELCRMSSWDRADIEITRARKGLPPQDNLAGMPSWDRTAVLRARAEAEIRRLEK